jgi:hypothetical protein
MDFQLTIINQTHDMENHPQKRPTRTVRQPWKRKPEANLCLLIKPSPYRLLLPLIQLNSGQKLRDYVHRRQLHQPAILKRVPFFERRAQR